MRARAPEPCRSYGEVRLAVHKLTKVRAAVRLRAVAYYWFELVHAPAYVATHAAAMWHDMQF